MQIKQNYLAQHLQKKTFYLYWLSGQDTYLLESSLKTIKNYIKSQNECDEKFLSIQAPGDWLSLREAANNYSLFSENTIINILYDKKTLDSTGN